MNFRRSRKIILLIELIILNLVLRVPIRFHEEGVDSFYIHMLSNSISTYGFAKWEIHPASIFGLYPLSYPSGIPTLLSGISQTSGLVMEIAILIFTNFLLPIIGIFSVYLFTKELFDNDLLAFISSFIFSISPLFYSYTSWNVTARGAFITLLPLFIWLLIKSAKSFEWKYIIPVLIFLLLLAVVHRLFILLPFIFVIFALGLSDIRFEIQGNKIGSSYGIRLLLFLFLFFGLLFIQLMGKGVQTSSEDYYTSSIIGGSSPIIVLLNICLNYATGISPFLMAIPFGLIVLFPKAAKKAGNERFLLISLLVIVLIMSNKEYGRPFSLVFISFLIAYSLTLLIENRKKFSCILIMFILLTSIAFSVFLPFYRAAKISSSSEGNIVPFQLEEHTFNLGLFIKEHTTNIRTISNDEIIGIRTSAISGNSCTFPSGPTILVCDLISKEKIKVEQMSFKELLSDLTTYWKIYDWFEQGYYYEARHRTGLEKYPGGEYEKDIFKEYEFDYLVEHKGSTLYSSLVGRIRKNAHKTYDNGYENSWYFGDISYEKLLS